MKKQAVSFYDELKVNVQPLYLKRRLPARSAFHALMRAKSPVMASSMM